MNNLTKKQLLNDWNEYRNSLVQDIPVEFLSESAKLKKRAELEANPLEWIKYFFPKYTKSDFSTFQKKAVKRILANPEWYEVLSWSRECSKTTTTMFIVLFLTLTGKKRNVILTSNSYDNAERLLEPYRANLDSNARIKAIYGEQMQFGAWEMGDFKTKSGVSFRALGAGQSPRGTKNEEIRPDVLIQDDFDTDEDVLNPDTIKKKWNWFEQALYPTRSINIPLLILWCGNIIARDCCITRAGEKSDNWDVINIRDKNGKSTWPEKNNEEHIDRTLSKISTKAQQQEYFNNPISEGDTFKELKWGTVPALNKFRFLISYGDPSPSNNKTKANSYKSNFLIGAIDGIFYIITGYLDKATNAEYVEWFYNQNDYVKGRTQVYFFTENNTLQDPFYQQVFIPLFVEMSKQKGHYLSIKGDDRKKPDKYSRIEGTLEPLNRLGKLVFNEEEKGNPHMIRLAEQFLLVTPLLKAPADGPDCVEGAVYIANTKNVQYSIADIKFGKTYKNNKRV